MKLLEDYKNRYMQNIDIQRANKYKEIADKVIQDPNCDISSLIDTEELSTIIISNLCLFLKKGGWLYRARSIASEQCKTIQDLSYPQVECRKNRVINHENKPIFTAQILIIQLFMKRQIYRSVSV